VSATIIQPATPRRQRSQLAVPASNPRFIEKAAQSTADAALNDIDWGSKTVQVRINGLDTEYMYRDVIDIVEACPRLDMLLIPKVGVPADVYMVDTLVTQIEMTKKRSKRIGFDLLIETALGMSNVEAIAASSTRTEALSFGVGDYGASTRARSTFIGGNDPDYGVLTPADAQGQREFHSGDMWHYAMSRMLVAARAYGLRPIDGPFANFSDPKEYEAVARRAAALGYEGKWAIHPTQIDIANDVFSPSEKEIAYAKRIMEAMAEAQREGRGAVSMDGRLIDIASIKMAENLLRKIS
jgi:malyl-CoA/(S)-citramalyl-CoA lyase